MRRIQDAALDLFEAHGFDRVTVEQIAARAAVGPATVYRSFGSKERIVLWDEYDPLVATAIAARLRLPGSSAVAAVRDAVVATLDGLYRTDRPRILRRARLVLAHAPLSAAAAADLAAMRQVFAGLLARHRSVRTPLQAEVLAGAIGVTLEAAIRDWVRAAGRPPLRRVLGRAFGYLERVCV